MPRRRRTARRVDVSLRQDFELLWGPHGDFRQMCPRCREAERAADPRFAGATARNRDQTRGTELEGFHADDLTPCLSVFDSPEEREAAHWQGDEDERSATHPGTRRWSWWLYEAPGQCRHRPRCERPPVRAAGDTSEQAEWLDRHGLLSARERAMLARRAEDPVEPGLEDDG